MTYRATSIRFVSPEPSAEIQDGVGMIGTQLGLEIASDDLAIALFRPSTHNLMEFSAIRRL